MNINVLDLQEALRKLPKAKYEGEICSRIITPFEKEGSRPLDYSLAKEIANQTVPTLTFVAVRKENSSIDFWFEWELVL